MSGALVMITGGARSGKSGFALTTAARHEGRKAFIATLEGLDDEMAARIEAHRKERGHDWVTFEVPLELGAAVRRCAGEYDVLVVDCLTLWLSNLARPEASSSTSPSLTASCGDHDWTIGGSSTRCRTARVLSMCWRSASAHRTNMMISPS